MFPFVLRSMLIARNDRRHTNRARTRRRCRIGLELLEDRITPTSVTGLSPNAGPLLGGTAVTITGTGFTGATAVDFGPNAATDLDVVNATTITADSPVGTGTVDVTVTAPGGTSPISPADQFTYVAAPTVSAVSPNNGPAAGGTMVTITGTGFTRATTVDFASNAATNLTVASDTSMTAYSPVGTGTVDVTVTSPGGMSATSAADQFSYAPTISSISPTAGTIGGGTVVTLMGTGFAGATEVDFGTTPATTFTVGSATTITALSPPGTGSVGVTVTTASGTSATSPGDVFTYLAAPTVTGISPTAGPLGGGTPVTITGTDFTDATVVDFGTNPATSLKVVSDTTITADSPAGTGTVDVTVTSPGGTSATSPADQFTYQAAPTVTGVGPTFGPAGGGTLVTISGTGFTGATAVDFGTNAATDLTSVSATSITAMSPAGTETVDVTVTTPGGVSATSPADQFTYAPTVTSISPTSGPLAGGTLVTITGTGFTGASAVDFGTTPATTFTVGSATTITALSPAGTGSVGVTVMTPSGTSATSTASQFTYEAAPTVAGISPIAGPLGGGTPVTIIGTGFTGATVVDFGTSPATNLDVVNDTTITANSPAGTGTVGVTVTTPGGTSATSPADQFTYQAAPSVTGIGPTFGPAGGGTLVTITGTGFADVTAVDFGTSPATDVTIVSNTMITGYSPAGAGTVDVTVTTPGGTSATSAADRFTYAPIVSGISPIAGPLGGGTLVTLTGMGFTGATAVMFGTNPATSVTVVSASTITALSPAGTGSVAVTVIGPGGTSATSPADVFTYQAAPTVTGISPTAGPLVGGTPVTITGTGFTRATAVDFGMKPATNVTVVSDTTITADSPAGTAGTVDVTVTAPGGMSTPVIVDQFTYVAAPIVSVVSPNHGPAAGDTLVTITGTGFTDATMVDFGTIAATNWIAASATSITLYSPAGTGAVDVTVTTPGGTSANSPDDVFTYAPTVSSISPSSGPLAGDTLVTITGTGFIGASAVDFAGTPATTFTVVGATTITALSPPGTGAVGVTVTTPGGTSATSPADVFTYLAAPSVTNIGPTAGPLGGGTLVTITGTDFTETSVTGIVLPAVTAIDFGTTPATIFNVINATTVTVVSPAGTGTVDVTVTTPGGISAKSPADQFSYVVTPTVSAVSPNDGPAAGGTLVAISGSGFTNATAVLFGPNPATNLKVLSDTSISVGSPAGSGTVDVTVTSAGGPSATSPADQFTYMSAAPTVAGVSPNIGPLAGGTVVTITGTNLANATAVDFGTAAVAGIITDSATQIVVISPAVTNVGAVNVNVTTAGGTSATSSADLFYYSSDAVMAPRVLGIGPNSGPSGGGTLVTITGTGFTQSFPMAVYFGQAAATNVTVVNATTITAESPAGTGTVDVTVSILGETSATSGADVFTYTPDGPQVTSVQRYGYHAQPTYLVIDFNSPLDPTAAQNISNYQIVGPGNHRIKVKSAVYNPATHAVTLLPAQRLILRQSYTLTINGRAPSGLRNPEGLLLDGAGNGQPGTDYVTSMTESDLAGPAGRRPIAAVVKARVKSVVLHVKTALRKHVN
jgi:large repetitive protein